MPSCVAVGCRNTSYKGYAMKSFPRDSKRRKEWADQVKRADWYPTDTSTLCEMHFAPDMWEKDRVDGKKKLKYNAIPTIFPILPTESRKLPNSTSFKIDKHNEQQQHVEIDENNSSLESINELEDSLKKITTSENKLDLSKLSGRTRKRKQSLSLLEELKPKIKSDDSIPENISNVVVFDHCYTKINEQRLQNNNLQTQAIYNGVVNNNENNVPPNMWGHLEETGKKPKQLHLFIKLESKPPPELVDQQLNKLLPQRNPTKLRPLLPKGPIIFTENQKIEAIAVTQKNTPIPDTTSITPITSINNNNNNNNNSKLDLAMPSGTSPCLQDQLTKIPETTVLSETATSESKKLLLYEKLCQRQRATIVAYRNRIKNSDRKYKKLEEHVKGITDSVSGGGGASIYDVFNDDQIAALQRKTMSKSTKFMKWSDPTIFKALRLKFTCGADGYDELLKQNIPLPSEKTLQRRLQNIKFESGIVNQIFDFLKVKIDSFNNNERDCCMILEEMEIVTERTYDDTNDKYYGEITLPQYTGHEHGHGNATHVQVFILAGINTRWKQIVAYHFTGGSIDDLLFKDIINKLLKKTKEINLNVISITTAMEAASNQTGIWGSLNMNLGRHKTVKNTIDHPLDPARKIYIFADVPKLFKQFKMMLIMNKTIKVPEYFQDKHKLPTNIISSSHIFDLISYQSVFRFRLVPKATFADLLPYDFDRASTFTSKSKNVQNVDISKALKLVAKLKKQPEYLTTAWFVDVLEKWFDLLTAKSPVTGFNKYNEETYKEIVTFLYNFMEIVDYMEVGDQNVWKPTQTAALISTKSMIQVQNILLNQKNYNFLLTGRFSSNYLENLFNVLKAKKIRANAQNVRQNLKILCVAQYLKCTKSSSIDEDDRAIFQRSNFIGVQRPNANVHEEEGGEEEGGLEITQNEIRNNEEDFLLDYDKDEQDKFEINDERDFTEISEDDFDEDSEEIDFIEENLFIHITPDEYNEDEI